MYVFIAWENTLSFSFWAEHIGFIGCDWEAFNFLGSFCEKESEIILYIIFYVICALDQWVYLISGVAAWKEKAFKHLLICNGNPNSLICKPRDIIFRETW